MPLAVLVLLASVALLRGSTYLPTSWAIEDVTPVAAACAQVLVASAVVLAVLAARRADRAATARLVRERPLHVLALGLTQTAIPLVLVAIALRTVPSGLTAVLIASTPLFVALLGPVLGQGARTGALQAFGLGLGLLGVAAVVGLGSGGTAVDPLGALCALGAAGAYASGALVVQRWFPGTAPVPAGSLAVVGALPAVLPLACVTLPGASLGLRACVALVLLGVFGVAGAVVLFVRLIQRAGPQRALLVTYLNPAVALVLGVVVEGDRLTLRAVVGLALILVGVAVGSRRRAATADGSGRRPAPRAPALARPPAPPAPGGPVR